MTQMLLFGAPASAAPSTGSSVSVPSASSAIAPVVPVNSPSGSPAEDSRQKRERAVQQAHRPGLNHMGDLARLVLLRHDLVAARRNRRKQK